MFRFLIGGGVLALAGLLVPHLAFATGSRPVLSFARAGVWMGGTFFLTGLLMILSSRFGKQIARDRLLDRLALQGDETVLDVGCGRGLLLIGAAKRLPHGRAVGIDLWSAADLSGNLKAATLENARREGVEARVDVRDGDMREMPFADASFDAVVANLSIHNIYDREGRRKAIREIARVLKPGGKVALQDFQHVDAYAADLRDAGLRDVRVSGPGPWIFPPVKVAFGAR